MDVRQKPIPLTIQHVFSAKAEASSLEFQPKQGFVASLPAAALSGLGKGKIKSTLFIPSLLHNRSHMRA